MPQIKEDQKRVNKALELAKKLETQTHYNLTELQMVAFSLLILGKSEEDVEADIIRVAETDRLSVSLRGGSKSQNTFLLDLPIVTRMQRIEFEREQEKDEFKEHIKRLYGSNEAFANRQ